MIFGKHHCKHEQQSGSGRGWARAATVTRRFFRRAQRAALRHAESVRRSERKRTPSAQALRNTAARTSPKGISDGVFVEGEGPKLAPAQLGLAVSPPPIHQRRAAPISSHQHSGQNSTDPPISSAAHVIIEDTKHKDGAVGSAPKQKVRGLEAALCLRLHRGRAPAHCRSTGCRSSGI